MPEAAGETHMGTKRGGGGIWDQTPHWKGVGTRVTATESLYLAALSSLSVLVLENVSWLFKMLTSRKAGRRLGGGSLSTTFATFL